MNLLTGVESTELFGGEVPAAVRRTIDGLHGAPAEQIVAVLWSVTLTSPQSLAAYHLLYKFHAGRCELDEAEHAAHLGLRAAAHAAGLNEDWQMVQAGDANFHAPGPARFWLFTLKALAFIGLRRGERETATQLITQLRQLDPADHLGFGVVEALLQRSV
ncbi:hypothetical protein B0G80_1399 [Paraburkholderia sp. BL6669N2]|uniref:hypothetical protein n=1 Tax=Paraburkholderia sp. BL6669N2 TaxID=1938807 RepID=UPI000E23FA41|nr:hypothetical protein [Paraburkholderia sp. BL6669N2]REG58719.1 hypothetical protein B0G80_1399 [Paraburkholderia sp. BL6669N2]